MLYSLIGANVSKQCFKYSRPISVNNDFLLLFAKTANNALWSFAWSILKCSEASILLIMSKASSDSLLATTCKNNSHATKSLCASFSKFSNISSLSSAVLWMYILNETILSDAFVLVSSWCFINWRHPVLGWQRGHPGSFLPHL